MGITFVIACFGLSYPHQSAVVGSPVGATFNNAKFAGIVFAPATGSATTTSILNTDGSDRKIEDFTVDCSGVGTSLTAYTGTGLSGLSFTAATTSTASPVTVSNTNSLVMPVATATVDVFNQTGTATSTPALSRVWASGSYMTFVSNATNTAVCTVGVDYLGS